MALNETEIIVIDYLRRLQTTPRILSLGYPDLLIRPAFVDRFLPAVRSSELRVRSDSRQVADRHRFSSSVIFDAHDLFGVLGCELTVVDFADLGHGESILNLNHEVGDHWRNRYDLVIDPGTVEHCFNVATAMANIANMLRPGGFVFHQGCICFPNHGFYSLSPTFFVDFYAANGFAVGRPHCWRLGSTIAGTELPGPVFSIDQAKEYLILPRLPLIAMQVARLREHRAIVWPIQHRYGNSGSHGITFETWAEDALSIVPGAHGGRFDDAQDLMSR